MNMIFVFLLKFEFSLYLLLIIITLLLLCVLLRKRNLKLFLLSLIGCLVPLLIFESMLAFFMPVLMSRGYYINKLDSLKTYKSRMYGTSSHVINTNDLEELPKIDSKELSFDYVYETFANGFRYTKSNLNAKEGFCFLGCSFTYGHGLKDEDTLTYQFAELYNFDKFIINCSHGGVGTNSALNKMEQGTIYEFINKSQKVNCFIYSAIGDHINRNFNIRTFNLADDSYIVHDGKGSHVKEPLGFLKIILQKSYIFNNFFLNIINERNKDFHKQYFIDTILKMDKLAKEKYNSKFIVVLWPDIDKIVIEKLKNLGINVIEVPEKLQDEEYKIKKDSHPNGLANKEISKLLFDYINNHF